MFGEPVAVGRRKMTPKESGERKILVPLDGSEGSRAALPVALALSDQLAAAVEVLYVSEHLAGGAATATSLGIPASQAPRVAIRTVVGSPGEEILKAAKDRRVELVVLATAGHCAVVPAHLAPVAEEIAARAVRPVVLVPSRGSRPAHYARLLVPLDGSLRTTVALKPAMRLAHRLGARLDLLYVVDDKPQRSKHHSPAVPMYMDHVQEWGPWRESAIEQYRYQTQCSPSVDVGMAICVGDPAEQIIRFAQEHKEDAVVLVRRSHLEYGHAAVLRPVVENAPCPVILVPRELRRSTAKRRT
jgi:nucleotide-binding universal stress UspA family protein